ncbi:ureidoglycolate lyase [Ruminococcaceae bacterium OttesenSCG-928-D13]|nr:ureidoglycolate lyase [Ruminococcaceae bacterium OttesenSCG-928-D13]
MEITSIDFSAYGTLYNMTDGGVSTGNVNHWSGPGYEDINTTGPLIDTLGYLGHTRGSGTPFTVEAMERHMHTQEALFCTNQPIVFAVAAYSADPPRVEDIVPVILRPGYTAVLHRGTWHSSAHGLDGEAWYHYLALVYFNEPTVLLMPQDGPFNVFHP